MTVFYFSNTKKEKLALANRLAELEGASAVTEDLEAQLSALKADNAEKEEEVIEMGEKLQDAFMLQEQVVTSID